MNLRDTLITVLQADEPLPTAAVLERLADAADNLIAQTHFGDGLQECIQRARAVALVLRSVQEDLADEAIDEYASGDTEPIDCLDTEPANDC